MNNLAAAAAEEWRCEEDDLEWLLGDVLTDDSDEF